MTRKLVIFDYVLFGRRFLFVIGTPDGKNDDLKMASLMHDLLCQFRKLLPLTKQEVNNIFKQDLRSVRWPLNVINNINKFLPVFCHSHVEKIISGIVIFVYHFAVQISLREKSFGGYK